MSEIHEPDKINFEAPVPPRSRAWCSTEGCGWTAWGIWSHAKAQQHHLAHEHMVHLVTPDTDEEKVARAAYLAEREAERAANELR